MSFWYDLKQKAYSTDKNNGWLKAYADRIVSLLKGEITTTLDSHFMGETGRHSANDIDLEGGKTLEQSLSDETTERLSGDAALSASISAEAAERKEADAQLQSNIELKADKVAGKELSSNDYTDAEKAKLAGISAGAEVNSVTSVAGKTGTVTLSKSDVGLNNIDNTADINKPISTAVQNALDLKADTSSLDNKADVSSVLTKTNATAFTPTGNYQPATKKYVDDSISDAGGGDMMKATYDTDNSGIVDNAEKLGGKEPSYYAAASDASNKAPISHATSATTYGVGTSSNYGHLKVADNLTTTSASGIALSARQGKILNEKITTLSETSPVPPTIASASPDGTAIGSDAWTGTGFFCTAENTRYSVTANFTSVLGFNRFCLKTTDTTPVWKNWTPYLDYDGHAYEFFYSPVRGLYETLVPETSMTPDEIVSSIRWEYHPPTELKYGKLINAISFFQNSNYYYASPRTESYFRDSSGFIETYDVYLSSKLTGTTLKVPENGTDILSLDVLRMTIFVLLYDVAYHGCINSANNQALDDCVVKASTLPIESCDNF